MVFLEQAIKYGLSKLGYDKLRGPQHEVVEAYAAGKDVFLSSPTGSGKSLCFEIAPYVLDKMKRVSVTKKTSLKQFALLLHL